MSQGTGINRVKMADHSGLCVIKIFIQNYQGRDWHYKYLLLHNYGDFPLFTH